MKISNHFWAQEVTVVLSTDIKNFQKYWNKHSNAYYNIAQYYMIFIIYLVYFFVI